LTVTRDVLLAWSGGKDSALALRALRDSREYRVAALLTTVTSGYERVSMHGVRRTLVRQQASAIGIPLEEVVIPPRAGNAEYEQAMAETLVRWRTASPGITLVAFGDLFLADIRAYREQQLARIGMEGVFPLWLRDTRTLAQDFVRSGFRAVLVCVDTMQLDPSFAGRDFDEALLAALPATVDPCGENGEFHTFVSAGPIFRQPVPYRRGVIVRREERFAYCDLVDGDG
jgi:uncharacterized protein (TIGR00290 family)